MCLCYIDLYNGRLDWGTMEPQFLVFFLKKKHTQDSAFFILLFQVLIDLVFLEQNRVVRARPLIVLWKTSSGTLHAGITDLTGVSLALFLPR